MEEGRGEEPDIIEEDKNSRIVVLVEDCSKIVKIGEKSKTHFALFSFIHFKKS